MMEEERIFEYGNKRFVMRGVEGGVFYQGAQNMDPTQPNFDLDSYGEGPVVEEKVDSLYFGETVVTQGLWKEVTGKETEMYRDEEKPVIWVNYYDIRLFLERLNGTMHRGERLPTNEFFDLPTEAEWEYAARGGLKSKGYRLSGGLYIDELGWYGEKVDEPGPQRVRQRMANELGLYDMSGNVNEWTQTRNKDGKWILKGGSYREDSLKCRITSRRVVTAFTRSDYDGFRLVLRSKIE